jgi:23S rRNA (adenine2503-C2)-methyltransferase
MKEPERDVYTPRILTRLESTDGETRKDLLELEDGEKVEVVFLRYGQRCSACISSQIGCACGCVFCATGQMGFVRQLDSDEIVAQALHVQRELSGQGMQLSNVVLMGMGEPLLNYEQTIAAIRHLVDQREVGLAPSRVTLSTVGIPPGIERMAEEGIPIKLAISLHAATDDLRDRLVPINHRYPLDALFAAVEQYVARTQRRVMFEWVMIDGINDTREQAEELASRLSAMPCHVNLIRLNPTDRYAGRPAGPTAIDAFARVLDRAAIPHTMRQRRGGAIQAGCGQLHCQAAYCVAQTSGGAYPQEP